MAQKRCGLRSSNASRPSVARPDGAHHTQVQPVADQDIVEALYAAGAAATRSICIVRGICCLRAGVPGLSQNIRVRSVLGRYLEHSRIYRFAHGNVVDGVRTDGAQSDAVHLIGSADLMPRNLNRRVEVMVPIEHPRHVEWLDQALAFDVGRRRGCVGTAAGRYVAADRADRRLRAASAGADVSLDGRTPDPSGALTSARSVDPGSLIGHRAGPIRASRRGVGPSVATRSPSVHRSGQRIHLGSLLCTVPWSDEPSGCGPPRSTHILGARQREQQTSHFRRGRRPLARCRSMRQRRRRRRVHRDDRSGRRGNRGRGRRGRIRLRVRFRHPRRRADRPLRLRACRAGGSASRS